jgi:hypothetical protein
MHLRWECLSRHPPKPAEIRERERSVRHVGSSFLRISQDFTGCPAVLEFVNCGLGVSRGSIGMSEKTHCSRSRSRLGHGQDLEKIFATEDGEIHRSLGGSC